MEKILSFLLASLLMCTPICGGNGRGHGNCNKGNVPTLTFIGHSSIKIKSSDGKVIYIDPYADGDYSEAADYILVTHDHDDHNKINLCTKNENCKVITWNNALIDGKYQTFKYKNIKIETVPSGANSYHTMDTAVGYIVTVDGVSVFHAGDTSMNDYFYSLKKKHIDYALYPIDGMYNMDAVEASKVANIVNAKYNIPIHSFDSDGSKKSDNFNPIRGKLVLEYGQTIKLKK